MEVNLLNLRNSINKAYLKVRPNRTRIEVFKKNITALFNQIKESESEEFHKNIISEFLKSTYYSPDHYINTKGRADLVIHNGKDTNSPVGVLFEAKKPGNKPDMPTTANLNTRAFHELILYFMRERVTDRNLEIKNLVITNVFEWFIFNANDFEKLFASDKDLVKQFTDFEQRRLSGLNTEFFYKNIAEPFIEKVESQISVTYFDIRDFATIIKNTDTQDDNRLIALYKIFSPEHLLKLPFANDSNNLDKTFYNELLHIIGLEETKEGSKKIIGRKKPEKRYQASLIENTITILKYEDCLNQIPKRSDFGKDLDEQLFNVALELVITWINRILFLKLLEGQLVRYNGGDKTFRFLNTERVHDYDELNKLFFQVLAVKEGDRNEKIKEKFGNIPYLNSSLFEPNDLEHKTIRISNLDDHFKLPVLNNTVLKDKTGKKLKDEIDPILYLFEFLDSYDFSGEGSEDIQEENKTLINASVLGLIFEKINGYKDGSFFTPGFITMYMCHETIRRAVVQKFNEAKGWKCETINSVYNKIEDIEEANKIINSLRICDPAVGSGHFLVSALNEIIAIKSELKVLTDREGKRLKEYTIEVINDELIITDEQSNLFEYNPKSKDSQRVQEALFIEKQKIIENCLFGVDINPNSVKICRLRLWIELLKNAYYKPDVLGDRQPAPGDRKMESKTPHAASRIPHTELETLPNIDINIKCGNSLISRYSLDANIKSALKSSKWNVDNYREAVMTYRNAHTKEVKRSMEELIIKIKTDFETEVSKSDKRFLKLNKLNGELLSLTGQSSLFELTKTQKDEWNKKVKKLTEEIKKYETELEEIKSNKIYENAFEWRFEFPEVLNNDGDFVGFDVVIGNPPYKMIQPNNTSLKEIELMKQSFPFADFKIDLFHLFFQQGYNLLNANKYLCFIAPSTLLNNYYVKGLRDYISMNYCIKKIVVAEDKVFEEAEVHTAIYLFQKELGVIRNNFVQTTLKLKDVIDRNESYSSILQSDFSKLPGHVWNLLVNEQNISLIKKIAFNSTLDKLTSINRGLITGDRSKYISSVRLSEKHFEILTGSDISRYFFNRPTEYILFERPASAGGCWDKNVHFAPFKICVRQIGFQPTATLVENPYAVTGNIFTIIHENKDYLKCLLGIINSKLISYYWKIMFYDLKMTFPQITIFNLGQIPLPELEEKNREQLINIVSQILLAKKSAPASDTSAQEAEIDRLVYELYGLTEEEIGIVEEC
jgi:hypothetical protein